MHTAQLRGIDLAHLGSMKSTVLQCASEINSLQEEVEKMKIQATKLSELADPSGEVGKLREALEKKVRGKEDSITVAMVRFLPIRPIYLSTCHVHIERQSINICHCCIFSRRRQKCSSSL